MSVHLDRTQDARSRVIQIIAGKRHRARGEREKD